MSELEKALTDAIKALTAARRTLNEAAWVYDDAARNQLVVEQHEIQAVLYGIHEGEMHANAASVDDMLTNLRRLRKEERR